MEREISAIVIQDKEVQEYAWDFEIPPRSRIQENITKISKGGFTFSDLKFKKGYLATMDHSWGLAVYGNQINAYLQVPRRNMKYRLTLQPSKLELVGNNNVKATHNLRFHSDERPSISANASVLWAASWINSDKSWDDSIDLMRITMYIEFEIAGTVIKSLQSESNNRRIESLMTSALGLDASEFFLSRYLSDVIFECDDREYPAHRFILTCKSPVFSRMFQHSMREATEGRIIVNDIQPDVLKELLRFIYCGRVENIEQIANDLFIAADKYDLEVLKVRCEHVMMTRVTVENALEIYTLSEAHNSSRLMERAVEILKRNRKEIIPDAQTLRDYINRYPELIFELYHL